MRTLILSALAATLCVAPAIAQPQEGAQMFPVQPRAGVKPPAKNVNSEIKRDLEDFVRRLEWTALASNGGYGRIFGSFSNSTQSDSWARQTRAMLNGATVQIQEIRAILKEGDGKTLPILISYNFKFPDSVSAEDRSVWERPRQERVRVKRASLRHDPDVVQDRIEDDGALMTERSWWQIVAPDNAPSALQEKSFVSDEDFSFWNDASYHLTPKTDEIAKRTLAERSTDKLWQLGVSTQWLVQEHEGRYRVGPNLINALIPYVQNPGIFHLPDSRELYTFNDNLLDLQSNDVKTPAQTVLFYEGQNETPTFRYDGKAAICFADGHVALVSPDEAKNLVWKP